MDKLNKITLKNDQSILNKLMNGENSKLCKNSCLTQFDVFGIKRSQKTAWKVLEMIDWDLLNHFADF